MVGGNFTFPRLLSNPPPPLTSLPWLNRDLLSQEYQGLFPGPHSHPFILQWEHLGNCASSQMLSGNLEDSGEMVPLLSQLDPTKQTFLVGWSGCVLGEERGFHVKLVWQRENTGSFKHGLASSQPQLLHPTLRTPKALLGGPWKPLMNNLSPKLLVSDALFGFENHIP